MENMISISIGVAIAAYGEAKFDAFGVILQLGAVGFEATRLVLVEILLGSKGIKLNLITTLYYVAPSCLCFLFVPWIFVEYPILMSNYANSSFNLDYFVFGSNALCAFGLNLTVFLLVSKTSTLTMNVAGVVKDWLFIAFSWSVIRDTVTVNNLVGYGLVFLGVGYYDYLKWLKEKANEATKKMQKQGGGGDEEAGSMLLEVRENGSAGGGGK